jgi:hypothetical protein
MRGAGRRAAARIPDQAVEVCACLSIQSELEAAKTPEIDRAADPTGRFMSALLDFPSVTKETSETLRRLGYHLGRFIYIVDAVDDLEQDRKNGAYNPLLLREIPKESLETSLSLDLAQIGNCIGKLPLIYHKYIIENIVYLGMNAVKDEVLGQNPAAARGKRRYLRP